MAAALLSVLLAACANDGRPIAEQPPVAEGLPQEPQYRVGDVYAFDNPEVSWRVISIGEDRVHWRSSTGDTQVTTANPLLPALEWQSDRFGHGRRVISGQKGSLFPMRVGAKLTFRETVSLDQPPYGWEFDWACEVVGRKQVVSQVGPSNTYQINCGRQRPDEYVFYYSPEIGHYVRMETITADPVQRQNRHLVAFVRDNGRMIAGDLPRMAPVAPPAVARAPLPPVPAASDVYASGLPVDSGQAEIYTANGPDPSNGVHAGGAGLATPPSRTQQAALMPVPAARPAPAAVTRPVAPVPPVASRQASIRAPGSAGVEVHLASYRNPSNAERGWRQLVKSNGDVLGDLQPAIHRVDLGERGVFYRLQATPIANRQTAETLCRQLRGRGTYCQIAGD
ncbi:MAG: SPOR domain-containing protein [Alphaproteobacteria bacterium]